MSESEENGLVEEIDGAGGLRIQVWHEDFQHALEGHPEVTIERVRGALKAPFKVVESKHSKRACLFYSLEFRDEATDEARYFCVVVGVLGDGKGKMETAYETTYVKKGKVLFERGENK